MNKFLIILFVLLLAGCSTLRKPGEVIHVPIPEGYLQLCELPAIPENMNNGELSGAFAQAYKCGEQGNKDKERIRNLPRNSPD